MPDAELRQASASTRDRAAGDRMPAPARRVAFEILRAVNAGRDDLPALVAAARERLSDPRDQALVAELTAGTLRWRGAVDHLLARYARRPLSKLDPPVLDSLRLGAYQLLHLDRVPARAAISDAVDLVKAARLSSAAGLVNAVLRAIDRDRDHLELPPDPGPGGARAAQLDHLSITLSHPRWLVERWLDRVGYVAARAWATFNNGQAPLTLRVNTQVTTTGALRDVLEAEGVRTEPTRHAPDGLIVQSGAPLTLPLAGSGAFFPQDEASQVVGAIAAAAAGRRILDVCASPGGKTLALAAAAPEGSLVVAMDLRPRRVELLRRTVAASRAQSIRLARADALAPLPFGAIFDLVLLDAPCSGLGTVRRDPEIRWRRTPDELAEFAAVQLRMLRHAADVVRPGGRLVYATCSSEPDENDEVVSRLLAERPELAAVDPRTVCPVLPPSVAAALDPDGRLRTSPAGHNLEAFFAAMLVKRKHL